jgi:hypothetical protein
VQGVAARYADLTLPEAVSTPWGFLAKVVWTKDEASGRILQFPAAIELDGERRFAYLEYLTSIRMSHKLFAIDKCRRMMISWWLCSLYLYAIMTQPNAACFWVSKKLEDAAYILGGERIMGVYERIPKDVWPNKPTVEPRGKRGQGYEVLECRQTGSFLRAVPEGADQLRQYTGSLVCFDEFAFQERQRDAWTAAKPTVDGGGHIDVVSTAELGAYMFDLLYGEG